MSLVSVNYEALENANSEMKRISGNIDTKLGDLKQRLAALHWDGQDRIAYEQHQAEWDAAIRDINQILNEIGGAVGVARENYVTTEMSNRNMWG